MIETTCCRKNEHLKICNLLKNNTNKANAENNCFNSHFNSRIHFTMRLLDHCAVFIARISMVNFYKKKPGHCFKFIHKQSVTVMQIEPDAL